MITVGLVAVLLAAMKRFLILIYFEYLFFFESDKNSTYCYFWCMIQLISLQVCCLNETDGLHPDQYPEVDEIGFPKLVDRILGGCWEEWRVFGRDIWRGLDV
eukprot:TRINITY_DN6407_c0_g4_i1.p1 TRINITY_DN6407_c0_g4~~TRINITY_DN6407_c0_g4_i1.p1  ORF type:complete len:102 (+),score=18.47 TRINITY_DN6407_c0_g4_i1:159-464(+)